jgi:hypothetical protein
VLDTGRPHDVSGLSASALERVRRELTASLALARPGSPVRAPTIAHLTAIDAELTARTALPDTVPAEDAERQARREVFGAFGADQSG